MRPVGGKLRLEAVETNGQGQHDRTI